MGSNYTLKLDDKMEAALAELAERQGIPKSQLIRRAVGLMKYLSDSRARGEHVQLVDSDGHERELVFEGDL